MFPGENDRNRKPEVAAHGNRKLYSFKLVR